jgi:BirA family biotin operon repressor/biotin-[acetyl-CoA-carboxylase] ligase
MNAGMDTTPIATPEVLRDLPAPFRVVAYDRLGSTNDVAKTLARAGAGHGLVVWAREQTAGRGRQGREWQSPPGNLHVSLVLSAPVPVGRWGELSFVAAVAAAETVADVIDAPALVNVKWPNDVLVGGAKVAGLLMEAEPGGGDWVILGIGVNLARAPEGLPYRATALSGLGCTLDCPCVLARLVVRIDALWTLWARDGFASIRERWLGLGHRPGDRLQVRQGETMTEGSFVDLDGTGALVLATEAGMLRVTAGDVFPVGAFT